MIKQNNFCGLYYKTFLPRVKLTQKMLFIRNQIFCCKSPIFAALNVIALSVFISHKCRDGLT